VGADRAFFKKISLRRTAASLPRLRHRARRGRSHERKFQKANRTTTPDACVYVGMTASRRRKRFAKHKAGSRRTVYAEKYGLPLLPKSTPCNNPMPYEGAREMEVDLAIALREQGYGSGRASRVAIPRLAPLVASMSVAAQEKVLMCPNAARRPVPAGRLGDDPSAASAARRPTEASGSTGPQLRFLLSRTELPVWSILGDWCGPCHAMPRRSERRRDFRTACASRIEIPSRRRALRARYGIRSIPTLILFPQPRGGARLSAMDARSSAAVAQPAERTSILL